MFGGKKEGIKWESQLDDKNIYKLIYSLQIIESFLEDIEISSENIDSFSNEESILGETTSLDEIKNRKIDWMKTFISQNGFTYLIKILENKLAEYSHNTKNRIENSLMSKICLDLLLKITRIFFSSSLNKFDVYRKTNKYINSLRGLSLSSTEVASTGEETSTNDNNQNPELLQGHSSSKIDQSVLEKLFIGDLGDKIISSINYKANSYNLLSLLSNLILIPLKTNEENSIFETSFSFLIGILGFAPEANEIEKKLIEAKDEFEKISLFGLLNKDSSTRILFSNSLITLCAACQENKRFDLLSYLFSFTFKIITGMGAEQEANSAELFDFFSSLFEIYLSNPKAFENSKFI